MLVNCEVAYINTMHPEFIGYQQYARHSTSTDGCLNSTLTWIQNLQCRAAAPAQGQNFLQKKGDAPKTVNMGNQVVRRGYLSTPSGMTNQNKEYWFVLNSDSMAWYKDEQVCPGNAWPLLVVSVKPASEIKCVRRNPHMQFVVSLPGGQEQEQKYNLKLAGCKVREHKSSSWTGKTRYAFEIFNPEMRHVKYIEEFGVTRLCNRKQPVQDTLYKR
jgi:hypothetical protein